MADMFVYFFDFFVFFLLQQGVNDSGVMANIMVQYFQVLFCLFHKIVPVFQPFDIGFLYHVFPVGIDSPGFAFEIAYHNGIGYKHGDDDEQDSRNIIRIVVDGIWKKRDKGKAAIKKYGDQT